MISSIDVLPVMSARVTPRTEVVAGGVKEGNSVKFCGIGAYVLMGTSVEAKVAVVGAGGGAGVSACCGRGVMVRLLEKEVAVSTKEREEVRLFTWEILGVIVFEVQSTVMVGLEPS